MKPWIDIDKKKPTPGFYHVKSSQFGRPHEAFYIRNSGNRFMWIFTGSYSVGVKFWTEGE